MNTLFLLVVVNVLLCRAEDTSDDPGYEQNPILALQPQFARSLPVQILLIGIVFTLTAVLLFHLIATAQYHWPLAPLNYALQLSGVLTLFISLIATIQVILSKTMEDSQQWPYMLNYLAIDIPNFTSDGGSRAWSVAELVAWYIMDATTSALVHITHIQFLTLLYPSHLEARLIMFLLGPLALISASMELLPIQQSQKVVDIADTIRNTCNAALSLLFTVGLVIWGFFVNRRNAWRTDGGTAAFGCGALVLAFISTFLNFLYIPSKDNYSWLPRLIWAVVLWQSFLGWWWWVGGGMGVRDGAFGRWEEFDLAGEVIRREERRERRRKVRDGRKERAQAFFKSASKGLGFSKEKRGFGEREKMVENYGAEAAEEIELVDRTTTDVNREEVTSGNKSYIESTTGFFRAPMRTLRRWTNILRQAHFAAVNVRAADDRARKASVYDIGGIEGELNEGGGGNVASGSGFGMGGIPSVLDIEERERDSHVYGWGLGSFGIRERGRREKSGEDLEELEMRDGILEDVEEEGYEDEEVDDFEDVEDDDDVYEDDREEVIGQERQPSSTSSRRPRTTSRMRTSTHRTRARRKSMQNSPSTINPPDTSKITYFPSSATQPPSASRPSQLSRSSRPRLPPSSSSSSTSPKQSTTSPSVPQSSPPSSSFWWWGPLRRWRLQDATVYSDSQS